MGIGAVCGMQPSLLCVIIGNGVTPFYQNAFEGACILVIIKFIRLR